MIILELLPYCDPLIGLIRFIPNVGLKYLTPMGNGLLDESKILTKNKIIISLLLSKDIIKIKLAINLLKCSQNQII